jgi:hypothetical protein
MPPPSKYPGRRFFFNFGGARPLHNAQSLIFRSGGGRPFRNFWFLIFRNPLDVSVARFTISSPIVSLYTSWLSSRFQNVAAPRSLGFWFHWSLPGASFVFFGASILSGFIVPNCLSRISCPVLILYCGSSSCRLRPIPPSIHNFLESEYPWRYFYCTVPLLRDGTPSYSRQPTFSGIHNILW